MAELEVKYNIEEVEKETLKNLSNNNDKEEDKDE
jgi:hypothetical protein